MKGLAGVAFLLLLLDLDPINWNGLKTQGVQDAIIIWYMYMYIHMYFLSHWRLLITLKNSKPLRLLCVGELINMRLKFV